MSYFSQFVGAQVPIGGIIIAPAATYSGNPTINGVEFLQTGLLKAYSSTYASLFSALPTATSQVPSTTSTGSLSFSLTNNSWYIFSTQVQKGGSYYYLVVNTDYATPYGPSMGAYGTSFSATAVGGLPSATGYACYDSITFNGNALFSYYAGAWAIRSANSSVSSGATVVRDNTNGINRMFAASSTLCVAACPGQTGIAGDIVTSTDGITWTSRTPSINMGTISALAYSTAGGTFIFVTQTGAIYTSTDGYTLTLRTSPSGMPTSIAVTYGAYGNSSYSGTSSTACLISIGGGSSTAGPYLLKTTTGTTFTLIDLKTVSGVSQSYSTTNANTRPMCVYDQTTSKFVMATSSGAGALYNNVSIFSYSSDNGTTWSLDSTKSAFNNTQFQGMNSLPGPEFVIQFGYSNGYSNNSGSGAIFTNKVGNTPDYVGIASATSTGSLSSYVRVA